MNDEYTLVEQRILIIADSTDEYIPELVKQLGISIRYSKLKADTFDLSLGKDLSALSEYSSILVLSRITESVFGRSHETLRDYVRLGGGLTFLSPLIFDEICELLGIESAREQGSESIVENPVEDEVQTIHFVSDRFDGFQNTSVTFQDVCNRTSLALTLEHNVQVDAYFDLSQPAIWHRKLGLGEVGVWSFVPMGRHWGRSLLLHSVIQTQQTGIKSIANAAVFQIDDFPAPLTDRHVPASSDDIVPWPEFIERVWLPDLLELAKKYRLVYSYALVFNYNHRTEPPFGFEEWESHQGTNASIPALHAHRVSPTGEIGLHGYNHLPLTIDNWTSRENMIAGLKACLVKWKSSELAGPPTSYVPPMNVYDRDGANALIEACPTILALCGNFWGPVSRGCGREFSRERWTPKLFCVPRITSGYELDASVKWKLLSSIYELGVWTHFVHPDDILDVPRDSASLAYSRNPNSRPWTGPNGLRSQLEQMLNFIRTTFPWLTSVRATDSATIIREHLDNSIHLYRRGRDVVVISERSAYIVIFAKGAGVDISKVTNSAEVAGTTVLNERTIFTLRIQPGRTSVGITN